MSRPSRRTSEERIAAKRARAEAVEAARAARRKEAEEYRTRIEKLDADGTRNLSPLYARWVVGLLGSDALRAALSIAEGKAARTRDAILARAKSVEPARLPDES